jgi:hypothetical protein
LALSLSQGRFSLIHGLSEEPLFYLSFSIDKGL